MKRMRCKARLHIPVFHLLLVITVFGCARVRTESEEIFKSGTLEVRLTEEVDRSGMTIPKGYSHPWNTDLRTLEAMLASIRYRQSVLIVKRADREAFPELERRRLLEPLRQAFARATPDQAVDFRFVHTSKWMLFQREYLTDGVLFVRDGALNCAFRNIAFEELADPEGTTEPFRGDPTETPYRTSWSLDAGQGQQLAQGSGKGLLGPKIFHNWIQLDLSREWTLASTGEGADEQGAPVTTQVAGPEPPEAPDMDGSPVADREEIQKQLDFLEELYKEGTLSALAYEKKKQDLLDRLNALPPAEE